MDVVGEMLPGMVIAPGTETGSITSLTFSVLQKLGSSKMIILV
ncbi:hypothetical protein SJ928_14460 [Enterococcus faecium]